MSSPRIRFDVAVICAVGFRLARVPVRDPAHRQAGQITNGCSGGLGDRDGQRADARGLIHTHILQQERAAKKVAGRPTQSAGRRLKTFLPAAHGTDAGGMAACLAD